MTKLSVNTIIKQNSLLIEFKPLSLATTGKIRLKERINFCDYGIPVAPTKIYNILY